LLKEAGSDMEAEIVLGLLKSAGIPAKSGDMGPYAGAMRVIGGQAVGLNLFVPERYLQRAEELLRTAELAEGDYPTDEED